jgi:hypothetical protein
MNREYAELSLEIGLFCGAADNFLGGTYFIDKVRLRRWDLTQELFESLKQEARTLGVPDEVLATIPAIVARHRDLWITLGMQLQDQVDRDTE